MENPFHFNAATSLDESQIESLFISDYNYSRFVLSKRNVFLMGERGCGKTMTLLYNKLSSLKKLKKNKAKSNNQAETRYIPVYVSCINPLHNKREHLLLNNNFQASVIAEHFLVLSIAHSITETLIALNDIFSVDEIKLFQKELQYIFDEEFTTPSSDIFRSLQLFLGKQLTRTQKIINHADSDSSYFETFTFSSMIMPIIEMLLHNNTLEKGHIIFMIDDAHDLNNFQQEVLNSWVAYRNNSQFSFKISAAKVPAYSFITSSGGSILRGHDYIYIDIEQPYQNDRSAFSRFATKIVERRLKMVGLNIPPEDFFPVNPSFATDLKEADDKARIEAEGKYNENEQKKITDYVYKYGRAKYFRERDPKANKPPYSGFRTIVEVSSGVVRNLLEPCFIMYEDALSEVDHTVVGVIKPRIQTAVLNRLSEQMWNTLSVGVDKIVTGCPASRAKHVENLFNALAVLFRDRLLDQSCSEPRAIAFTISKGEDDLLRFLNPILETARQAQFLYMRPGSAKDKGAVEDYYVPNKLLWPSRGLDPIGQHARVSLTAKILLDAATNATPIKARLTAGRIQAELKFNHNDNS